MAKPPRKSDDDALPGVKKIGDIKRHRSTVLYGRSGTGKTTLAASWPGPILYLDIKDEGTDSIADVEGIDVKEIESGEDLDEVLLWLIRNPKKYKTVILDTLSQLQEIVVEEVAEAAKKKLTKGKRAGDFGTLTKQDWGQVSGRLKSWIIDFRDLPMETVFIAQDRTFNLGDEADDANTEQLAPEVGPRLMPSVASVLNAAVSIIGNTFIRVRHVKRPDPKREGKTHLVEKKEYCLRLGPSAIYVTKVRKPKEHIAPDFIVDPTYEDIIAVIQGDN